MAKNMFCILTKYNVWWASIMEHKYGDFDIWTGNILVRCSWFYRGMCRNAKHIRPFLWLKTINPSITSFLNDPWYFEIPIAFKPTYFNMEIDFDSIQISNLLVDTHWNIHRLQTIFGTLNL